MRSLSAAAADRLNLGFNEGVVRGRKTRSRLAAFAVCAAAAVAAPPVGVSISGLHITVPAGKKMDGVAVFGHQTTLSNLTVDGSPRTDVLIGAGARGSGGMIARVAVTDSTLSGGQRDVISAYGPIG